MGRPVAQRDAQVRSVWQVGHAVGWGCEVSAHPDHDLADRLAAELDEYPTFMDLMEMQERLGPLADYLDGLGFDHDAELVRRMLFPTGTVGELRAERDEFRRQLDTLLDAIGDIEDLRYRLDGLRGGRFTSSSANRMERIADAVDALAAVGDPKEGR